MPWLNRKTQRSWKKQLASLRDGLQKAESLLTSHHIDDARFEAELLLMHALGIGRARLYLELEQPLPASTEEKFWNLIQHRLSHEPTAYILKQCQFYGIDLYIDSRALIPRPETELLVEEALDYTSRSNSPCGYFSIVDVGTGSGAIAVALAHHLPQAKIYAIDISKDALEITAINCQKHKVSQRVHLLHGDMLYPLYERVNIIVANLPYIRDQDISELIPEIKDFEPGMALAGGIDGLDKIRQLLPQASQKLLPGGLILLEIGQGQSSAAVDLARSYFPDAKIDLIPDLAGIDRVVRVAT